jgi:hypothetical protein
MQVKMAKSELTCTAEAPVSSILLVTLSGSPTVLLVTGRDSIFVLMYENLYKGFVADEGIRFQVCS